MLTDWTIVIQDTFRKIFESQSQEFEKYKLKIVQRKGDLARIMKCSKHDLQQNGSEKQTTLLMLGAFAGMGAVCALVIAFPMLFPFFSLLGIGVAKIMNNFRATDLDTLFVSGNIGFLGYLPNPSMHIKS